MLLPDLLAPAQIAAIRERLDELLAEARNDPTWHAGGTLHLDNLADEGPAFDAAWSSESLLAAIRHVIGEDIRVTGVGYRAPAPGYGAQALHADFYDSPAGGSALVATAIVALVPFTENNGPTRVLPGSHRARVEVSADTATPYRGERRITCSAGTALVFNGHLYHSGTRNDSGGVRHALQITFAARRAADRIFTAQRVSNETYARLGDLAFLLV